MPWTRTVAGVGAVVFLVLAVTPPVLTGVSQRASLEAVQFGLLAVGVPALTVLWAPQRYLAGLAVRLARLSEARQRHASFGRSLTYLVAELAAIIAWRTPAAVDAIAAHPGLVVAELITLVPLGIGLWAELLDSPPLATRLPPGPGRALLAAVTMWTIWILAYLGGFSHGWYPAYGRHGNAAAWDQQITSAVLWFTGAAAFVPFVFYVLHRWLSEGERPDAELRRLVREERRRRFVEGGAPPRPRRGRQG